MTKSEYLIAIRNALGAIKASLTKSSDPWDIFEGYVMCLVLVAAKTEGCAVSFHDRDGAPVTKLLLRTSPSELATRSKNYCYIRLEVAKNGVQYAFELHTGVYIVGRSGVSHESDVLVLYESEGNLARQGSTPRSKRALISVECKCYERRLPLSMGRQFLGLCRDLSAQMTCLAFNTYSESVEKLLSRMKWEHRVVPRNNKEIDRLKSRFQEEFKEFLSRR